MHRETKENLATTNVSRLEVEPAGQRWDDRLLEISVGKLELTKEIFATLTRKPVVAPEISYRNKLIADGGVCAQCERADMLTTDQPCNSIKSDWLDFSFPQTKQIMLKLLERLSRILTVAA